MTMHIPPVGAMACRTDIVPEFGYCRAFTSKSHREAIQGAGDKDACAGCARIPEDQR